jgi:hypothetical protein
MKTHIFNGNYGEVKCKYFFDETGGVDVYVDGKHIGEYYGMSIPDEYDEEEYVELFEEKIENWLDSNY